MKQLCTWLKSNPKQNEIIWPAYNSNNISFVANAHVRYKNNTRVQIN